MGTLGQAVKLILSWESEADDVSLAKVSTSPAGSQTTKAAQRVNSTPQQVNRQQLGGATK